MGEHEQVGIAGGFSVDEYERDLIQKHERTRRDKEDDRTRHILELRAQTGPGAPDLQADAGRGRRRRARHGRASRCSTSPPPTASAHDLADGAGDGRARRGVRGDPRAVHRGRPPSRGERSARACSSLRGCRRQWARTDGADTFLAVAFPDDQMQVLPYHRVVKDLGGHTPAVPRRAPRAPRGRGRHAHAEGSGRGRDVPRRPLARARPLRRAAPMPPRPIGSTSHCSRIRC